MARVPLILDSHAKSLVVSKSPKKTSRWIFVLAYFYMILGRYLYRTEVKRVIGQKSLRDMKK